MIIIDLFLLNLYKKSDCLKRENYKIKNKNTIKNVKIQRIKNLRSIYEKSNNRNNFIILLNSRSRSGNRNRKEKRKLTNIKEYLLNRDKYREGIVNYFTGEISDVNERIERLKERKDG